MARRTAERSPARAAHRRGSDRRWVRRVRTVSTYPPPGLFTRDAETVARVLASPRVSPRGPASGLRMLIFFLNRGGRGLSPGRRAELERAKRLLSERIRRRGRGAAGARPKRAYRLPRRGRRAFASRA